MATYSEDGRMVSCDCPKCKAERDAMSPVESLSVAIAESNRRREQGIRILPRR
jgi:phage FluMu protein Com